MDHFAGVWSTLTPPQLELTIAMLNDENEAPHWSNFSANYWPTILETFRSETFESDLFPTRRCWDDDYIYLATTAVTI